MSPGTTYTTDAAADHAALFEQVFRDHYSQLHAYAFSMVNDQEAAGELVQSVFCKLWERKDQVPPEHITAYLYKAVYHENLNLRKHAKIRDKHRAHTITNSSEADNPDTLARKEMQQKIDMALGELPEQCRTIFHLSRFEELQYKHIAGKLGISVKTVENHIGKALRILRVKLAEYLPLLWLLFIHKNN